MTFIRSIASFAFTTRLIFVDSASIRNARAESPSNTTGSSSSTSSASAPSPTVVEPVSVTSNGPVFIPPVGYANSSDLDVAIPNTIGSSSSSSSASAPSPTVVEPVSVTSNSPVFIPAVGYANSSDLDVAIPVAESTTEPSHHITPQQFDTVIVGAGWAGINAAKTLLNSGVSSILVLEANDYIGGRSKTINSNGSINIPNVGTSSTDDLNLPVDCGSEWLYPNNSMEDYLKEKDFLGDVDLYVTGDEWLTSQHSQVYVQHVDDTGFIKTKMMSGAETKTLHDRVWYGFSSFRETLMNKLDRNYLSAVKTYKKEKNFKNNGDIQYLNLMLDIREIDSTGESDKLSLKENKLHHESVHYMSVPGAGYGNVAASVAAPFSSKIKLDAKVTEINSNDPNNVIISYTKNGVAMEVAAKSVLVTASLGVLKSGSISFIPSLPVWKQHVIDKMGFGVMNKCIMQWNDEDAMVWPDKFWLKLITPEDNTSGTWTTFLNPSKLKGVPTLVGWIGGEEARLMEFQTDEEVLSDVMKNLISMFPTITQPDRVIVTRWGQNENVKGTYSFKIVGRSYSNDSWKLGKRVQNLWFAGEATAGSAWYATTVGAWKSGGEAAIEIAEELSAVE